MNIRTAASTRPGSRYRLLGIRWVCLKNARYVSSENMPQVVQKLSFKASAESLSSQKLPARTDHTL